MTPYIRGPDARPQMNPVLIDDPTEEDVFHLRKRIEGSHYYKRHYYVIYLHVPIYDATMYDVFYCVVGSHRSLSLSLAPF